MKKPKRTAFQDFDRLENWILGPLQNYIDDAERQFRGLLGLKEVLEGMLNDFKHNHFKKALPKRSTKRLTKTVKHS